MAETFENARTLILEKLSPLPAESVPLLGLVGRVLAEEVRAPWDLPRWDNSAMDGFAVRAEDCQAGRPLMIEGYIPAGGSARGLCARPGKAIRIMTGAQVWLPQKSKVPPRLTSVWHSASCPLLWTSIPAVAIPSHA